MNPHTMTLTLTTLALVFQQQQQQQATARQSSQTALNFTLMDQIH